MRRKGQPRQPNRSFTDADGIRWHSRDERNYWLLLKQREKDGEIRNLARQVKIELHGPNGPLRSRKTGRIKFMVLDFRYFEESRCIYDDWKGHAEELWEFKADLFCNQNPNVELRINGRKA